MGRDLALLARGAAALSRLGRPRFRVIDGVAHLAADCGAASDHAFLRLLRVPVQVAATAAPRSHVIRPGCSGELRDALPEFTTHGTRLRGRLGDVDVVVDAEHAIVISAPRSPTMDGAFAVRCLQLARAARRSARALEFRFAADLNERTADQFAELGFSIIRAKNGVRLRYTPR
jgi:hypothetical protein